ncbi:amidohydrolase [Indiicoccus explosivorum]|uniref:amidohydrolase n=1 Tax=Indiicoccus explosivorum TaxID=1917864 RepID=UPI000B443E25|nr:amidohydrolase [Indiicoccus explosivorum]
MLEQKLNAWFTHFHEHPEVSFKEWDTTKKLASIMEEYNIPYRLFGDVPGLIAEIGQGEEVIALRADMDALWQEVDGVFRANHSCGHDANMTMVLGALELLHRETLNRKVRFIFQPAEEQGNGALAAIDRGAADDVIYLFGVHLRPQEELPLGKVAPAIHHGAGLFLKGKITGEDAHGARPHQGRNAVDALFGIHQFIKSLYFSPYEPYSAKLTKLQAGGDSVNIIPGSASFAIDIRAQSNEVLEQLKDRIAEGLEETGKLYRVHVSFAFDDYIPAAEVSGEAAALVREAIIGTMGEKSLADEVVTPGGDDFHFYTIRHPGIKAAMVGVGADLGPGLHHPDMTFSPSALTDGAKVLAETVKLAANK